MAAVKGFSSIKFNGRGVLDLDMRKAIEVKVEDKIFVYRKKQ